MIKGKDMIPAHLLGMWPMKWKHLYKELVPYPAKNLPDLTKKMKEKGISKLKMIKMANEFFTNIGKKNSLLHILYISITTVTQECIFLSDVLIIISSSITRIFLLQ